MATSVRLSPETEDLLSRLAQRLGKTKSEVLRTAIRTLAAQAAEDAGRETPYEAMAHLIGCAAGGPRGLSARTGAKFAELLRRRKAAR
jgi:Arc/MetJ-type ribon-helix-helix transcriptional regulator